MKCPLLSMEYRLIDKGSSIYIQDCLKEECAWWDETSGRCAVLELLWVLGNTRQALEDIKEKMPHAGQFTK